MYYALFKDRDSIMMRWQFYMQSLKQFNIIILLNSRMDRSPFSGYPRGMLPPTLLFINIFPYYRRPPSSSTLYAVPNNMIIMVFDSCKSLSWTFGSRSFPILIDLLFQYAIIIHTHPIKIKHKHNTIEI
jgi:hypothetical protein